MTSPPKASGVSMDAWSWGRNAGPWTLMELHDCPERTSSGASHVLPHVPLTTGRFLRSIGLLSSLLQRHQTTTKGGASPAAILKCSEASVYGMLSLLTLTWPIPYLEIAL